MLTEISTRLDILSDDIELCFNQLADWRFDGLEKRCKRIKEEYKLIANEIGIRTETGKMLSKCLTKKGDYADNEDSLGDVTREFRARTRSLPAKLGGICARVESLMKTFYLEKGKWLYSTHGMEEALGVWEMVLRTEPQNRYVHAKLEEMMTQMCREHKGGGRTRSVKAA